MITLSLSYQYLKRDNMEMSVRNIKITAYGSINVTGNITASHFYIAAIFSHYWKSSASVWYELIL